VTITPAVAGYATTLLRSQEFRASWLTSAQAVASCKLTTISRQTLRETWLVDCHSSDTTCLARHAVRSVSVA